MVYLDYNATTPLAPEALAAMLPFLGDSFGNPSSIHAAGRRARAAVDDSRERLATLLGVKAHEIIFTSGGTEACNLAILGIA
ncbi:MAG TPA: aminotransferase class V-fold PLP-dependent enzyme, partial [Terrimicrobiaceae bacterium]|nr:aminotransferase class V-fold PLP-dependent enzyme [Terrimicrobiaceae bacterium]